eukprot:403377534
MNIDSFKVWNTRASNINTNHRKLRNIFSHRFLLVSMVLWSMHIEYVQPNWTVICGDSVYQEYEQCDDGNTTSGDGCSATCTTETGFYCVGDRLSLSKCYETCGDGKNYSSASTACDDGNNVDGDGCSSDCVKESGFACTTASTGAITVCTETCGDGFNMGKKGCDDGNTANGDGCSSVCAVETSWTCSGGSKTTADKCYPVCGDKNKVGGEQCDDGANVHYDGCTSYCTIETGFTCNTGVSPNVCTETCGDGRNMGFKACDDGNTANGDGCSNSCAVETYWTCKYGSATTSDTCTEICGDSVTISTNAAKCDDGNTEIGDGCDIYCGIEPGWTKSGFTYKEVCGDGRNYHSYADECDDGNVVSGDGCTDKCVIEKGYVCTGGDLSTKDTCSGLCGDGTVIGEACDDGNGLSGDGCDCKCAVESGFTCSGGSATTASTCKEICGDGLSLGFYQCDDGNTKNNDGCSSTCTVETGFTCTNYPRNVASTCSEICGDGMRFGITTSHICDDGNLMSSDGCDSKCKVEAGWNCFGGNSANPDTCVEVCGVGFNFGTKDCDDGNTINGDGCSSLCKVEKGWTCTGGSALTVDTCKEICGDGLDFGKYACDDGNYNNGDGCDRTCNVENYYTCSGGTTSKPDTCAALPAFYIAFAKVNANNTKMQVYLTENYYLKNTWDKSKWELMVQGPKDNYDYTWELDSFEKLEAGTLKPKYMTFNLSISNKLYGGNLEQVVVNYIDKSDALSVKYSTLMFNNTVEGYLNANDNESCETEFLSKTLYQIFLFIFLGASVIIMILYEGSFQPVLILLTSIQQMHILGTADYTMSSCLRGFFESAGIVNFNSAALKKTFASMFSNQVDYDYFKSESYKELDYETYSFLLNAAPMFIISACLLGSTFIVYSIGKSLEAMGERTENPRVKRIGKLFIVTAYRMPHAILRFAFMQLVFSAALDISALQSERMKMYLGSYLAIVVLVCYGAYALFELIMAMIYRSYILKNEFNKNQDSAGQKAKLQNNILFMFGLWASNKNEQLPVEDDDEDDDPTKPSRYQQLFGEYKYMILLQYMTFVPFAIKRTVIVMIALLTNDQPNVFLMLFVITTLVYMTFISYVRPFKEDYINILLVINEFFLVVEAGFMVLFCTPFGTTDMDQSYMSIIMMAAYMQIVVTIVVSGIVQYKKFKLKQRKIDGEDKVEELAPQTENPASTPNFEKSKQALNKPISSSLNNTEGILFTRQEGSAKGLNYNYNGSLAQISNKANPPVNLNTGPRQLIPLIKGDTPATAVSSSGLDKREIAMNLLYR